MEPEPPSLLRRIRWGNVAWALAAVVAAGLGANVGELLVDPVPRVAPRDDLLQAVRSPRSLVGLHRQRGVDRVCELLHVERVDRQGEFAELLVRAGVLGQDRDAVALVD